MQSLREATISAACRLLSLLFLPFTRRKVPARISSVLIIKPCCIGDVLLATAAITQLRQHFPDAKLSLAVGPWAKPAVMNNPRLDELIDFGPGLKGYLEMVKKARSRKFEACLVLERSPLLTLLPFLAGIPHRIGIDSGGRGFSLTAKVPWKGTTHEAELYLEVARALGVAVERPRLEFFPSDAEIRWAEETLAPLLAARPAHLVAVHPGGGENPGMRLIAKRWPTERYAELARWLTGKWAAVLLVGASADLELAEAVKQEVAPSKALLDLTGATTLGQLGALLQRCDLFVGNDTGPMHLAVAVGTPVVALFGPSHPATYGPFGDRSRAIYEGIPCSPCFLKGRYNRACHNPECMRAITVPEVQEAVTEILRQPNPVRSV